MEKTKFPLAPKNIITSKIFIMKQIQIRVQNGKKTKVLNAIEVSQGLAKRKSFSLKRLRFIETYFFTEGILKSADIVN